MLVPMSHRYSREFRLHELPDCAEVSCPDLMRRGYDEKFARAATLPCDVGSVLYCWCEAPEGAGLAQRTARALSPKDLVLSRTQQVAERHPFQSAQRKRLGVYSHMSCLSSYACQAFRNASALLTGPRMLPARRFYILWRCPYLREMKVVENP